MEPKLNFQVPAEGLEMLILQHRQYQTLGLWGTITAIQIFFVIYIYNFQSFLQKGI